MLISLIVPCYNEEESLPFLYEALCDVRKAETSPDRCFEFIFVNDGSRDKTAEVIKGLAENDKSVKYHDKRTRFRRIRHRRRKTCNS